MKQVLVVSGFPVSHLPSNSKRQSTATLQNASRFAGCGLASHGAPRFREASVFLGSILTLALTIGTLGAAGAPAWDAAPSQQQHGVFWRYHWYERGLANGNPAYEKRLRVNAPEISLHPTFGRRVEPRENGMMLIRAEEDLFLLTAAEFYCEAWGGHPGTANKRVTVNGRSTYPLPRVGTEDGHCTYFYPSVPLKLTDLVNGYDAVQFALDQGTTFWGHMLVDNAAIRVALTNGHPDLAKLGLAEFTATVEALPAHQELSRPASSSLPSNLDLG